MASKNKRKQTFKEEYSRSWDFIKLSRKGENHARCTLCSADFSIAASGRYDITQHIATAKHRSNAERKDSNQSILFVYVFKKYRFLLKNTGLWASKYRFVFPEVGMSVLLCTRCAALFSFRHFVCERLGRKGLGLGCVFYVPMILSIWSQT